jgi:hypothetical protein
MTTATATLAKVVRDPRSGEIHRPAEQVAILAVKRNLNRTLLKVRWQTEAIAWCPRRPGRMPRVSVARDSSALSLCIGRCSPAEVRPQWHDTVIRTA